MVPDDILKRREKDIGIAAKYAWRAAVHGDSKRKGDGGQGKAKGTLRRAALRSAIGQD